MFQIILNKLKNNSFLASLACRIENTICSEFPALMHALSESSDDALIAELARRRPDLVVVPRVATHIMALRGSQETGVFEQGQNLDFVTDYLDLSEVGKVPGFAGPEDTIDVDERAWLVVAAAWRGCIAGFEEWERLRAKEGNTPFVTGWTYPCLLQSPNAGALPKDSAATECTETQS